MSHLAEIFWEFVANSWSSID